MKSTFQKITSLFIAMTLMVSMIVLPSNVMAFDNGDKGTDNWTQTVSPNRANISFNYVGVTSEINTYPENFDTKTPPADGFKANQIIWVAVKMSKLSKVRDLFESGQVGTAKGGVNQMSISITYDNDVLNSLGNYGIMIGNHEFASNYTINGQSMYTLTKSNEDYNENYREPLKLSQADTTKLKDALATIAVDISKYMGDDEEDSKIPRLFHDGTAGLGTPLSDAPVTLAVFPFKLRSDQADAKKILQASMGGERFGISIGYANADDADKKNTQWISDDSGTPEENLKAYFNLVNDASLENPEPGDGVIDVLPTSYSIKFYTDETCTTEMTKQGGGTLGATKIPSGTTYADAIKNSMITEPTEGTDYPLIRISPDDGTTTQYCTGLKYKAADDSIKSYPMTTINEAQAAKDPSGNPGTEIKVYPSYEDAATIEFTVKDPKNVLPDDSKQLYISPMDPSYMNSSPTSQFTAPTGHSIDGWYLDENCTQKIIFEDEATEQKPATNLHGVTKAYAKYTENIKINYNATGGTANPTDVSAPPATAYTDPTDPTRTSNNGIYTFNGWNTKPDGSGIAITAATHSTYKDVADACKAQDSDPTPAEVTLYAQWTASNPATLTFDSHRDDASPMPSTITVNNGDSIPASLVPTFTTVNDYRFDGWYESASISDTTAIDFNTTPYILTGNKTVHAHWTYTGANPVTVEFYQNNGTTETSPYATMTVASNATIEESSLPTGMAYEGHSFDSWNSNQTGGDGTKFVADTTQVGTTSPYKLYAQWNENIEITYDANGGSGAPEKTAKSPDSDYSNPATNPTRTGYTFQEWNTKSNGSGTKIEDGTGNAHDKYQKVADAYNTDNATTGSAVTLYAIWQPTDMSTALTLNFDANLSGVTPNPASVSVVPGDKVYTRDIPVVSKTDYQFDGWYRTAAASDTDEIDFDAGYDITNSPETVYAHWTYIGNNPITVEFYLNDGTATSTYATMVVAPNAIIPESNLPTGMTYTGHTFNCWNTNQAGGDSTKFVAGTTSVGTASPYKLYAQWTDNIKVTYDGNGGAPATSVVEGAPSATYSDPATNPTRTGSHGNYTFLGWNTKKNGSGTMITGTNVDHDKFEKVANVYNTDNSTTGSEVTLYAQWGAVEPTDTDNPDPTQNGIDITFNGNGTTQHPVTKEANPQHKYPQLDDKIGIGNMPEKPVRAGYDFVKWNTKADGSGKDVEESTDLTAAYLGDALQPVAGTSTSYTMTLFAQWTPSEGETTVTLKFYDNTAANGGNIVETKTIVSGDSLGYTVAYPTFGSSTPEAWYKGTITSGNVSLTADVFNKDDAITADTDYFVKWTRPLIAYIDEDGTQSFAYTGQVIKPVIKIYDAKIENGNYVKKDNTPIATSTDADFASKYEVKYNKTTDTNTFVDLRDVAEYDVIVSVKAGTQLELEGAEVMTSEPPTVEVTTGLIDIKVDPATQKRDYTGSAVAKADIEIDTTQLLGTDTSLTTSDLVDIKYYKWTDKNTDGKIDETTVEATNELAEVADPTDIGFYVIKVKSKTNSNYKINSVKTSSTTNVPVEFYPTTTNSTYPGYTPAANTVAENIVFQVKPNDPSAENIEVNGVKGTAPNETKTAAPLKDSDYTTAKTFENPATPDTDPDKNHYYVRVDKDTNNVELIIDPKYDVSTPSVTIGTNTYTPEKNESTGKWSVTVPIPTDNVGQTTTDIKVTMSVTGADPKDYTITVQKLKDVEIDFNPGNSPYGLIERMKNDSNDPWSDDKIQQAKDAFNSDSRNKQYGANLIPKYGNGTLYYTTDAWQVKEGNTFVAGTNYDLDPSAIFVHQLVKFKDPGFTIYDQAGNEVTNPTITAKILKVVVQTSSGIPKYDSNAVGEDIAATQNATTQELEYDFSKTMVEPNKYEIEYTYTYTDLNDGTSKTFTAKRPVILGAKRGDIVLSKPSVVNVNDASNMSSKYGSFSTLNKYYAFRVADVQQSKPPVVNVNDNSTMRSKYGAGFSQFYDDSMLK